MKVLHVIASVDSRAGGPAIAMAGLCKAQRAAGVDVSVLATMRAGSARDVADDLNAHGVAVTTVGPTRGGLARHPQLDAVMRSLAREVEVIHAHGIWEEIQVAAARSAVAMCKPYIITAHGMLTPWSLKQKWLKKQIYLALRLRKVLNGAAAIHYTSAHERDLSAQAISLKPPALVEPLGVDLGEFEMLPPAGGLRSRFPQMMGKKIILFLGRIYPGKGVEYLVPALAAMKTRDAMVVIVGPDQNFQATIEQLINRHGVRDRVLFTGMMRGRERLEALVDADLFALPSEHENFGIVVVEALACGTPVVVSDGVALHGEVVAGQVGSSVRVGDVSQLAAELDRWFGDDSLRRAAAERARPFVRQHFDWRAVAEHWVGHYQRLVR